MERSEKLGASAALAAGIVWGFLGIFVREMTDAGFTSMQMTCLRYIIVFLVLAVYLGIRYRGQLRISPRVLLLMAVIGILGNAMNSTTYFSSMERISLSLATILQYFAPFLVMMASYPLFGEELTPAKIAAVVMAFCGCIGCTGLLTDPGSLDALGIAFGAASAVCFTVITLGTKKARMEGNSSFTILFYSSIFCFLFLIPLCDFHDAAELTFSSGHNLMLVIGLGILTTFLPFALYNYSLGKIEVGKAAVITYIEPLTATVVGFIIYSEEVTAGTVVGIILVLLALVIINRGQPGPAGE